MDGYFAHIEAHHQAHGSWILCSVTRVRSLAKIIIIIIIIIPLFTLGSIYRSKASGTKQTTETNNFYIKFTLQGGDVKEMEFIQCCFFLHSCLSLSASTVNVNIGSFSVKYCIQEFVSFVDHLDRAWRKLIFLQIVLWAHSSHTLLAQDHFLLILVNDFIRG